MLATINTFDYIEKLLGGSEAFKKLIPVVLTDNGSEFADPEKFETGKDKKQRTRLFYCVPRRSDQKGALERNHEFIRYVLPKGESFDELDQEFVMLLVNNINSYSRPLLEGLTPMDKAMEKIDQAVLDRLGLKKIPADEVHLTTDLITEYFKTKK
jgi:IS30 family transposase